MGVTPWQWDWWEGLRCSSSQGVGSPEMAEQGPTQMWRQVTGPRRLEGTDWKP